MKRPTRCTRLLPWLLPWLFAACAASPPLPELPPSHPASPFAEEAPEAAPSQALRMPPPAAAAEGTGRPRGH